PAAPTTPVPTRFQEERPTSLGRQLFNLLTTTDHKLIGMMYMGMAFAFFALGGLLALGIRSELWEPGLQVVVSKDQYNQLFTMHGTIMLLMFGTPLFNGFANYLVPLQIGAVDMAFPRLNMFAFWITGFGSLIVVSGFLTPQGGPPSAGSPTRRCRTPRSRPAWAVICGSSAWPCRASGRSWARSTSSPRSCACACPA